MSKSDIKDDYDFARSQYYNLAEKGNEAIDLMMELARESEHPRAFEVLSTAIKQNAEVADKLMRLHKERKDVEADPQAALPNSMTQNNLYVGSATDLQKMLIQKAKEKETIIESDENQE
tara:strand:- start:4708 stop:5064 length:357 start_codon:yes stop_codon:yes gene_type:complete